MACQYVKKWKIHKRMWSKDNSLKPSKDISIINQEQKSIDSFMILGDQDE